MKKITLALAVSAAAVMVDAHRAEACGGCFAPARPSEQTVVTDHRMALSISQQQTILWDQIQYSGDPREFAWVLPIRGDAKIELANDEFFSALDASTQPTTYGPGSFGGGMGCAVTGCSSEGSAEGAPEEGQVEVLSQSVVGPYETVTLRATDDDALTKWLTAHDYAIPPSIEPTIKAYVDEHFDFVALRLRPQCSERSMRPIRVVTSGANPTLPLRMVAAGVGARVGITLWLIAEGRWEPQNFPNALIDDSRLRWDRIQGKSNYEALSQELMAQSDGRTWLTEFSSRVLIPWSWNGPSGASRPNPGLADAYFGQCPGYRRPSAAGSANGSFTPCPKAQDPEDDGTSAQQEADAGSDAATEADAESDADAGPIEETVPSVSNIAPLGCTQLDDLDVAIDGMSRSDVWVTRLRAVLPANALAAGDLRLQAAAKQVDVSNLHYARYYTDEDAPTSGGRGGCGSAPKEHRTYGSWVIGVLGSLLVIGRLRRRANAKR